MGDPDESPDGPTRGKPVGGGPVETGEYAPDFEALLCNGETFQARNLSAVASDGCLLVFYGFAFSAIAENWWKRYDRRGWVEFPIPVIGVSRDGPYAQNAFLREIDSPFRSFSDVNGDVAASFGLLTDREGMAGTQTARRAVYLVDEIRQVEACWVMDDWISPIPAGEVEAAVESFDQ